MFITLVRDTRRWSKHFWMMDVWIARGEVQATAKPLALLAFSEMRVFIDFIVEIECAGQR